MMIKTIWQPNYTPPGFSVLPAKPEMVKNPDQAILQYLETNGMKSNADILKATGVTTAQLRGAISRLNGLIKHEQTGNSTNRASMYWVASNPPPVSSRNGTYRVWHWFQQNQWANPCEIPDDIFPHGNQKHATVVMLEKAGKLTSRRVNGGRKQYKVAA